MRYGEISTPSSLNDSEYIKHLTEIKEGAKLDYAKSENDMNIAYQNYKKDSGIFGNIKWEQYKLENIKKELEEEKRIAKNQAREQAIKEGKSEEEISQILAKIDSDYAGKIALADYNITNSMERTKKFGFSFENSLKTYKDSRYGYISTGNVYQDVLHTLFGAYLDEGRQNQRNIVDKYINGNKFDGLG